MAQQCAFDYCIWYRDNYIEACNEAVKDKEEIPDLPDWGDVYNYDELYGDYVRQPVEEGEDGFYKPVCVDYYRMYENAERRDAQGTEDYMSEEEEEEEEEEEATEEEVEDESDMDDSVSDNEEEEEEEGDDSEMDDSGDDDESADASEQDQSVADDEGSAMDDEEEMSDEDDNSRYEYKL